MYAGEIVECGSLADIYQNARHPYTIGLFGSIPDLKGDEERLKPIMGLMPDPSDLPSGCSFHPRCPHKTEECTKTDPKTVNLTETHSVKCLMCTKGVQYAAES